MDHDQRIHRPRAYNRPGEAHELTFSCYRRYRFFSKDQACRWLADAVRLARLRLDYSLWAYVFMPDHVHLIVYPRQAAYDVSRFLMAVKHPVSRKAVTVIKRDAPHWLPRIRAARGRRVEHHFWQPGRGHDRNIDKPATLQSMIDYIHLNPVRAGLAKQARDWTWSSAGWYEGRSLNDLQPDPIPWEWLVDAPST